MWLKILLLTLYLIFLFVLCRILGTVSWYHDTGTLLTSFAVLDPITLSVKKLKELLDNRGVSYSGVVEKHELVDLVRSSGKASKEELIDAMFPIKVAAESTHFTCGSHFYEEVEDTKDSAWLVQVEVDDKKLPLITEKSWEEISHSVGNFGVRSGVFKCSLDRRLCSRKGWSTSRLILALPRGHRAKEDVVLHNHVLPSSSGSILQWVWKHLASRVRQIDTEEDLEQFMKYSDSAKKSEIRVILFSFLKSCPMFLSALAIKFNGRVQFATVDVAAIKSYKKFANPEDLPSYLVVTPEKTLLYGSRRGECYNMKSMELYLKTFIPEMNDVFLWSLILANTLAAFEFIYSYSWMQFFLYVMCMIKYNCVMFLVWLLVFSVYNFPFMLTFTDITLKCLRIVSDSSVASVLRNDYKSFYSHTFLLLTLFSFASMAGFLLRKFKWLQPVEDTIFPSLPSFRPLPSVRRILMQELDSEVEMELLIERLAIPNFWLQPVISMDYIKNLPMWKYQGWCEADDEFEDRKGEALVSSDDENVKNMPPTSSIKSPVTEIQSLPVDNLSLCESATEVTISSQTDPKTFNGTQYESIMQSSLELCASKTTKRDPLRPDADRAPKGMLELRVCSICLENYCYEEYLCGLPCGHNFHMNCIMGWLSRDNHCCPICRWPSYKFKNRSPHLHSQ